MKQRLLSVVMFLVLSGSLSVAPVLADVTLKLEGKIAFSSNRTGNYELYIMDADGSNVKQLTDDSTTQKFMSIWSPDGKYIFYGTRAEGKPPTVVIMAVDGSYQRVLGEYILEPLFMTSFSPDGQQFIFVKGLSWAEGDINSDRNVYFVSDIGGNKTRELPFTKENIRHVTFLSDERLLVVDYELRYRATLYSTNLYGKARQTLLVNGGLFFSVTLDGKHIAVTTIDGLVTLDSDGKNRIIVGNLGNRRNHLSYMRWSPDSKMMWILENSLLESADPKTGNRIYSEVFTINPDGSNKTKIASEDVKPSWSPDSQYLTFTVTEDEKRQIVIARPDGTIVKTFASDSDEWRPTWQPKPTE